MTEENFYMHFQKRKRGRRYSERRAAATIRLNKEKEEKEGKKATTETLCTQIKKKSLY